MENLSYLLKTIFLDFFLKIIFITTRTLLKRENRWLSMLKSFVFFFNTRKEESFLRNLKTVPCHNFFGLCLIPLSCLRALTRVLKDTTRSDKAYPFWFFSFLRAQKEIAKWNCRWVLFDLLKKHVRAILIPRGRMSDAYYSLLFFLSFFFLSLFLSFSLSFLLSFFLSCVFDHTYVLICTEEMSLSSWSSSPSLIISLIFSIPR